MSDLRMDDCRGIPDLRPRATWAKNLSHSAASGSWDAQEGREMLQCMAPESMETKERLCSNATCAYKHARAGEGGRCGKCFTVWYCGSICHEQDWPVHKLSCTSCSIIGPFLLESGIPDEDIAQVIAEPRASVRTRQLWSFLRHIRSALTAKKQALLSAQSPHESEAIILLLCRLCQRVSLCHIWLGLPTVAQKWLERAERQYKKLELSGLPVSEDLYPDSKWSLLPAMLHYAHLCIVLQKSEQILAALLPLRTYRRRAQIMHMMDIHAQRLEAVLVGIVSDLDIFLLTFAFYRHNVLFLREYGEIRDISRWVALVTELVDQKVDSGELDPPRWMLQAMAQMQRMVCENAVFRLPMPYSHARP